MQNTSKVNDSRIQAWRQLLCSGVFKENAQLIFLCNLQNSPVNVCLVKILESTVTKVVIVGFNNSGEEKF